jgi:hypothetical protein
MGRRDVEVDLRAGIDEPGQRPTMPRVVCALAEVRNEGTEGAYGG